MQMNTTDFTAWDNNPVESEDGAFIRPAEDSSLAATWYRYAPCADCSENVFLAYQDSNNGSFQVVNTSRTGDVQYATVPGEPISGSGATFNTAWRSATRANLRLGYQEEGGQLASSFWNGTSAFSPPLPLLRGQSAADRDNYWETESAAPWSSSTSKAPLTSFTYGRGAPVAVPAYLFVLNAGDNGVSVDSWDNSDRDDTHWSTPVRPPVMQQVDALSPLAANGAGHVFAMQEGVIKEFAIDADGTSWRLVGDVTGR
ncbi:MAG: hypothetical protein Q9174_006484 [Haloplaca sp. 1 TL-2023]